MSAPTITKLTIPTIIDVSTGAQEAIFSFETKLGSTGLPIGDVTLALVGAPLGLAFSSGRILDSFNDATPTLGSVAFTFDGTVPPGTYPILRLIVNDSSGSASVYDAAQLKAMGLPTEYTVVNSKAPAAPTIDINASNSGLIAGSTAVITGSAAPGSTVTVSAVHDKFIDNAQMPMTKQLGVVQADANGLWSLNTNALADGRYIELKASASLLGNTSAYSTSKDFQVSAVVPATPDVHVRLDGNAQAGTTTPYIYGTTTAGAIVDVYDGSKLVASTVADAAGWFGTRTAALDAGSHGLSAIASNLSNAASGRSKTLQLNVAADAPTGITLDFGTITNESAVPVNPEVMRKLLGDVGAILSSFIDGNQRITLAIDVKADPSGKSWAYAAAGASPPQPGAAGSMPLISNAGLIISEKFATDLVNYPHEKMRGYINVLVHEILHVFGFNSTLDPYTYTNPDERYEFGKLTKLIDGKPYFTGDYASAVNGGPVELANNTHLAEPDDVMFYSSPIKFSDVTFFGTANPTAPFTALDLAILKDLGYTIKTTIVAQDGHTFIAGSGKPGYDQIDGTPGVDTLFINQARASFDIKQAAGEFVVQDRNTPASFSLDSIERIKFADTMLALDVNGSAGQIYRLYQAVLGRTPDAAGLGFWLWQVDNGLTLAQAADAFVVSAEFTRLYGSAPSADEIIAKLYANVLHRAPDTAGFDFWRPIIESNPTLLEEVLVAFSESAENKEQVAAVIGNGFEYLPWG